MALVPSIDLCLRSNCTDLIFTETTGAYSDSNTGGYGSPNVTIGSIISATLVVTNPAGTIYTIDLFNTGDFPTTNTTFEYTISLADIGNITSITDGYWTFVYTVSTDATDYSVTFAQTFTCSINCCLSNMLSKINLLGCDSCKNTFTYEDYVKVKALKDSLINATECGNVDYIEDTLDILTRLCNKSKCKTCN